MKTMKKIIPLLLAVLLLTGIVPGTVMTVMAGWVSEESYGVTSWYYQNADGSYKTGWLKDHGKWYYLNPDWGGEMISSQNSSYGFMVGNTRYYFEGNGALTTKTGWKQAPYNPWFNRTDWFYLLDGGVMAAGWQKISGKWYFFDYDGAMAQWPVQSGSTWYSMTPGSGVWMTGGKGWYHYDELKYRDGTSGWVYLNGDGTLKTGWLKDKGKWYYINPYLGQMVTGVVCINYPEYWLFDKSGALVEGVKGWKKVDGLWYYLSGTDGRLKIGWHKEKGKWYYLQPVMMSSSTAQNGWTVDGITYYFNADGTLIE